MSYETSQLRDIEGYYEKFEDARIEDDRDTMWDILNNMVDHDYVEEAVALAHAFLPDYLDREDPWEDYVRTEMRALKSQS